MSSLRLMLVRHGQTPANVRHALDSKPPGPPLTAEGRRQADKLAEELATEPVTAVYASVAVRAQMTAAPVALRHGVPVRVIEGVHETQVGPELEGRNDDAAIREFSRVVDRWLDGDLAGSAPGGETGFQVVERFSAAVRQIAAEHSDGVVVLVSHGAAIRLMAVHLLDGSTDVLAGHPYLPNTGRVVLEADPDSSGGWRFVEWLGIERF
ncbi:histidine phosphatase family protein [Crossiella sp. NPDC003009]